LSFIYKTSVSTFNVYFRNTKSAASMFEKEGHVVKRQQQCIHTRTVGWPCRQAAREPLGNAISVSTKYRKTE